MTHAGLRPDARKPLVGQRIQEFLFVTRLNFVKGRGLRQLGRDRANELVRGDPLADRDFQLLSNGMPKTRR
jgi:hypothetical protein